MTFSNVKLIFAREVRDQLRDRRTLFMIAVLPVVLYPLLGLSMLQVAQFMREQPARVLVVGIGNAGLSKGTPALFEKERFARTWFSNAESASLLETCFAPAGVFSGRKAADGRAMATELVERGDYEAAVYFPPDFAARLAAFRQATSRAAKEYATGHRATNRLALPDVPSPEIIHNTASDKSQVAFARLSEVLRRWSESVGEDNLKAGGVSARAAKPVSVVSADVATAQRRGGAMWAKMLPVLLMLWALTGAFYPAVDLCAGEKERGTLETLLCSPAGRSEIVLGKLLTVMLFSIVTAVLNLLSLTMSGSMVMAKISDVGLPPVGAIAALLVALIPMAALFSALCVALAAMARSTKEGQYYLMPLLLVTMPLVILPMSPGVELNLGNSLIPITGVVLVLRSVLEGDYWQALRFAPVAAAVAVAMCALSIRLAIEQFNRESVLFRESERLDIWLWLRHIWRDRQPTPSAAAALACAAVILVVNFFTSFAQSAPAGFFGFARAALTTEVAVIALPAVLMAIFLTSSPRRTLLLSWPKWRAIPAAALLAVMLHPAATYLQSLVQQLYPISENVRPALMKMQDVLRQCDLWPLLFVLALVPALCEELAFRGFILSGFRRAGSTWRAIFISSILFGVAHGILQQSLIAGLLGVLLGYVAVQSGSILPGIAFHACHNALAVANSRITPAMLPDWRLFHATLTVSDTGGCVFDWHWVAAGALVGVMLLMWFGRLSGSRASGESPLANDASLGGGIVARLGKAAVGE